MAAEYEEEEEKPRAKPKRPRKPIDWPLVIMLVGTVLFIVGFGLITVMAPRRPFLGLRRPPGSAPVAVVTTAPGGAAATTPAAGTTPAATPASTAASQP